MLLWLSATVAAAVLAPHFARGGMQLICSAQGFKFVQNGGAAAGDMPASAAHCPLCLLGHWQGMAPALPALAQLALPQRQPLAIIVALRAAAAPRPAARGPPTQA